MRVSREQAAENRQRVVETAGRLFRERGYDGIGVADLMKEAGLTHGGFYGQFGSKEALIAEASAAVLERSLDRWRRRAGRSGGDGLETIVRGYLSAKHRDDPGDGCLFTALGPAIGREGKAVHKVATKGLRGYLEILTELLPGRSKAARERKAMVAFASMVGAMVLARSVDDAALSAEILEAAADAVLNQG